MTSSGARCRVVVLSLVCASCSRSGPEVDKAASAVTQPDDDATRQYLDSVIKRFRLRAVDGNIDKDRPLIRASEAIAFVPASGAGTGLEAKIAPAAQARAKHPARVWVPMDASQALAVADVDSTPGVRSTLQGALAVSVKTADGFAVYRGGQQNGSIIHRIAADGAEDFFVYESRPAAEQIDYALTIAAPIAGLRLVENSLEFLDAKGTPRLTVPPPFVLGEDGSLWSADLSIQGCSVDRSPAPPWKRPVTSPGAGQCTMSVSWAQRGVRYPAVVDPGWMTTGNLRIARAEHVATPIGDGSGRVLVTGGVNAFGLVSSAEVFDPATGTWAITGSMATTRRYHTASSTSLGGLRQVVVAGGQGAPPVIITIPLFGPFFRSWLFQPTCQPLLATAETWSPENGVWYPMRGMRVARALHASQTLLDETVLVTGGYTAVSCGRIGNTPITRFSAPTAKTDQLMLLRRSPQDLTLVPTFVAAGDMLHARAQHSLSQIVGQVVRRPEGESSELPPVTLLAAGGTDGTAADGSKQTSESFDTTSKTWRAASPLTQPRIGHVSAVVNRLVLGPGGPFALLAGGNSQIPTTAETYDLFSNRWTAVAPMPASNRAWVGTARDDGSVLVVGGTGVSPIDNKPHTLSAVFRSNLGWTEQDYTRSNRTQSAIAPVHDGGAILSGGFEGGQYSAVTEVFYRSGCSANSAVGDQDCPPGKFCDGSVCVDKRWNAEPSSCNRNGQCHSGNCVPAGTCCQASCVGPCSSPFYGGDGVCVATHYCDGSVCVAKKPAGLACTGNRECASDSCLTHCCAATCAAAQYCDSIGACQDLKPPGAACTNAYECNAGYCGTNGVCQDFRTQGGECANTYECRAGLTCADGVCCDSACSGTCQRCALLRGASDDGACTNTYGPGKNPPCFPFACNGTGPSCPSTCRNADDCDGSHYCDTSSGTCMPRRSYGSNCSPANHAQCKTGHCSTAGVCACESGLKYCAALAGCMSLTSCCGDADCASISPPDSCHVSTGATCIGNVCQFPTIACSPGGACTGGACDSPPLSFTVVSNSPTYKDSPDLFNSGLVSFTATLTNVSAAPVSASAYADGNIIVASLSKDGVTIGFDIISESDDVPLPILVRAAIVPLAPGAFIQFSLRGVIERHPYTKVFRSMGPGIYNVVFQYQSSAAGSYGGLLQASPTSFGVQDGQ